MIDSSRIGSGSGLGYCRLTILFPHLLSQKKPGLSAYAADPRKAAESLVSLIEEAKQVVPAELRDQTPVRVGVSGTTSVVDFVIGALCLWCS